ncbi:hypothetical protein CYMTET_49505 [Cymbomonas tetramitiformis]|uniref:Uncharacterized protein n=1 Tax=Cymbomonas tetramitiformis TaxID=36881 RepID=A0AAE0BS07_9CHLO|nr:hypothetical protein CYMTET_49505 [Cymbomonas tetramitiformis]
MGKRSAPEVVIAAGPYAGGGGRQERSESLNKERKQLLWGRNVDMHKIRGAPQTATFQTQTSTSSGGRDKGKGKGKGKGNGQKGKQIEEDENLVLRRQFKDFRKDVEDFGVSGLELKQRKSIERNKLVSLGMKPIKNQRIPASIGRGMNVAKQDRDKKHMEEARMQGLKIKKPIKKKGKTDREMNAGLPGKYKNGVLHLNKGMGKMGSSKPRGSSKPKKEIRIPGM